MGYGGQLRPNHSASGTVQQPPTFPDVKLCFTTRSTIVVSSGTFKGEKKKKKNQAQWQIFLIVVFETGTTNEKNLSNSWQADLGVQKSYRHTFMFELSTLPLHPPFC